jgi:signal transduction histidine kinase
MRRGLSLGVLLLGTPPPSWVADLEKRISQHAHHVPPWSPTATLLVLFAVAVGLVIWALFRLRLRRLAHTLSARYDERLAERTRMARDFHDTLVQTLQGSKMVADDALSRPDDAAGMRRAVEQLSTWLGQASAEGRAAVNSLRTSTTERNELADAFRRAIEDCARQGTARASLSVTGEPRELHPVVCDEVYRIGYEAVHNACTHSAGNRLEVELSYGRDLTVRVADNGVGIDPSMADAGKEGPSGLRAMRERAARIGAKLTITSSADSGTDIILTVPGRVIFRKPADSAVDRLRSLFASRRPTIE